MITGNVTKNQSPVWQKLLADAIRDPLELIDILNLDPESLKEPFNQHFNPAHFPLRVPRGFVAKMQKGDWNDPLLKQVLPLSTETRVVDGFQLDPVKDKQAVHTKGLLQKYKGRVLVVTTGACAIHCRYCFRQHFPYSDHHANPQEWQNIIQSLRADTSINEVILSGGDPLLLTDNKLASLCTQIAAIPHIHTLRLHTRLPLVLPERLDTRFIHWFSALKIRKIIVIHANHANEFCDKTYSALQMLHETGTLLLNQSVLLKGINDSASALIKLSQTLIDQHVLPYYLHQLDRVQGAAHFEVTDLQALALMEELRNNLPGYLVPRLVREVSGKRSKTLIN